MCVLLSGARVLHVINLFYCTKTVNTNGYCTSLETAVVCIMLIFPTDILRPLLDI